MDLDDDEDELRDDLIANRALNQRISNRLLQFGYTEVDDLAFSSQNNFSEAAAEQQNPSRPSSSTSG